MDANFYEMNFFSDKTRKMRVVSFEIMDALVKTASRFNGADVFLERIWFLFPSCAFFFSGNLYLDCSPTASALQVALGASPSQQSIHVWQPWRLWRPWRPWRPTHVPALALRRWCLGSRLSVAANESQFVSPKFQCQISEVRSQLYQRRFCNRKIVFQHFSRSPRFSHLCTFGIPNEKRRKTTKNTPTKMT